MQARSRKKKKRFRMVRPNASEEGYHIIAIVLLVMARFILGFVLVAHGYTFFLLNCYVSVSMCLSPNMYS